MGIPLLDQLKQTCNSILELKKNTNKIEAIEPINMGSNVVGEHAPIRSASLVNAIQVYAVLRQNLKIHT